MFLPVSGNSSNSISTVTSKKSPEIVKVALGFRCGLDDPHRNLAPASPLLKQWNAMDVR